LHFGKKEAFYLNFLTETLSMVPAGRMFALDKEMLISLAILLFNVFILSLILSRLLYKPVREFMRKRSEKIKMQLDTAAEDMSKANELKIQYEEKIRNIEIERTEILESARKSAAEKSKQMIDDAKKDAFTLRERAAADVQVERERIKDEIKSSIIEISSAMAEKFMKRTIDEETQNKLFAETLAEVEEISWLN